jgi:hypothetical protein
VIFYRELRTCLARHSRLVSRLENDVVVGIEREKKGPKVLEGVRIENRSHV